MINHIICVLYWYYWFMPNLRWMRSHILLINLSLLFRDLLIFYFLDIFFFLSKCVNSILAQIIRGHMIDLRFDIELEVISNISNVIQVPHIKTFISFYLELATLFIQDCVLHLMMILVFILLKLGCHLVFLFGYLLIYVSQSVLKIILINHSCLGTLLAYLVVILLI